MYELQQMQGLPLRMKIMKTVARIEEWYDSHDGLIYVAYSGGIDSTVLGDIARKLYPDIPLVFCNTGQEYPEITSFKNSQHNITTIRPKHSYKWVVDKYGYPIISKEVSKNISRYRGAKDDVQRNLRLYGGINPTSGKMQTMGVIPKKYHYLVGAPFLISDKCCDILKKNPFKKYDKETGRSPMTGEMAFDSMARRMHYLSHGCNFYGKVHKSTPMGFWTDQDVLEYIQTYNVPYCKIYGDIIRDDNGKLKTTGERHTGCFDCMYGVQFEPADNNRFTRMKTCDPLRHDICINKYGQGKILDFIGIKY